jgi:diguanylate cyclase (GGDEF)-like protein
VDATPAFGGCAAATTVRGACEAVADELLLRGVELPSVYVLVGRRLRCQAARGYFQVVDGFLPGTGIVGRAVATGQVEVVPDVRHDPAFIGAVPQIVSEIAVPVVVPAPGGEHSVVGAVNAESTGAMPDHWLPLLQNAAAALGQRIGELGGLEPESLMQRVAKVAVELTKQADADTIESGAARAAVELSGMRFALIARQSEVGGLRLTHAYPPGYHALTTFDDAELAVMASWVDTGMSSHYPGWKSVPPPYDFLSQAALRSLSVCPLVARGDLIGILVVADSEPHAHEPQLAEALELLAALTGAALGTVGALADLRRQAAEDPLTGCGNVAAFSTDLDAALRGLPRDHQVACLMIDVDHFKKVNDAFGHPVGDVLLQDLSSTLRPLLRSTDRLYRVGGDEFAVIALVVDAAPAVQLAERLVAAARDLGTTISVGVACASSGAPGRLRARADDALYAAKRAGRDTTRSASD